MAHLRLDPSGMVMLPPVTIPATRRGALTLTIPNDPYLVSRPVDLHAQALLVDLQQNKGTHLTNVMIDRIKR